MDFSITLQEACHHYWEVGQQNATLKFGLCGRVTYKAVFDFYRKDLLGLGVDSVETFRKVLRTRSKHICTRS